MILYGNSEDCEIKDLILKTLQKQFAITYINKHTIKKFGKGKDLIIVDTEKLISDNLKDTIIIFKKDFIPEISGNFLNSNTAIVSSDQKNQLEILSKLGIKTITCGTNSKDTITFSSFENDALMVSLQRPITSINGKKILPFEKSMCPENCDEYSVLAYFALSAKIGLLDINYL